MKILFFTDSHLRSTTPPGRIDSYSKSLEKKFEMIHAIKDKEEVDVVLCGGDVFHTPTPAFRLLREYIEIFKKLSPIYVVDGSHDKFGYSETTLERTALGIMEAAGVVTLLNRKGVTIDNVHFVGIPHTFDLDTDPKNYFVKKGKEEVLIEVAHGMVVPNKFFGDYTLISELETEADYLFCGHYHPGFNLVKKRNTTIINPGSLGRVNNLQSNRRFPQVVLLNTKTKELQVIALTKIEKNVFFELEKESEELQYFMSQLQIELEGIEIIDVRDLVISLGKKMKVGVDVLDRATKILDSLEA